MCDAWLWSGPTVNDRYVLAAVITTPVIINSSSGKHLHPKMILKGPITLTLVLPAPGGRPVHSYASASHTNVHLSIFDLQEPPKRCIAEHHTGLSKLTVSRGRHYGMICKSGFKSRLEHTWAVWLSALHLSHLPTKTWLFIYLRKLWRECQGIIRVEALAHNGE